MGKRKNYQDTQTLIFQRIIFIKQLPCALSQHRWSQNWQWLMKISLNTEVLSLTVSTVYQSPPSSPSPASFHSVFTWEIQLNTHCHSVRSGFVSYKNTKKHTKVKQQWQVSSVLPRKVLLGTISRAKLRGLAWLMREVQGRGLLLWSAYLWMLNLSDFFDFYNYYLFLYCKLFSYKALLDCCSYIFVFTFFSFFYIGMALASK